MFETTRETTTIAASGNANSRYFLAIVHLSCSIGEVLMILSYTKYDQSKNLSGSVKNKSWLTTKAYDM